VKPPAEVAAILRNLESRYPSTPGLKFQDSYQLLMAAVLSAQSTDNQVNQVTPGLFARFPDAACLAAASPETVAELIRGVGLNLSKARYLVGTARQLVADHQGVVPADREALMRLPGVGRKTANVILANAFQIPALAVDTHVFRVSRRLGLAHGKTPAAVEQELTAAIPQELWSKAHHWLIWHGRQVCLARRPRCSECVVQNWCDYFQEIRS